MLPPGTRLVEEARAAVGIEHPNLLGVLHVAGGVEPYVVSEAPEGVTLDSKLRREQKLKVPEAIRIAWGIASGLSCLHGRGLVHRGVNPAAIWIGPGKRIRLGDVGLTPPSEDSLLDALTQPAGIPGFQSPEQAVGEEAGAASDLFSLGCVLYQMVTGQMPFMGSDLSGVIRATVVLSPRPPRQLNPAVPEDLQALILKLLEKFPRERPRSAREVVGNLEKVMAVATEPRWRLPALTIGPPSVISFESLVSPEKAQTGKRIHWKEHGIAAAILLTVALALLVWWCVCNL